MPQQGFGFEDPPRRDADFIAFAIYAADSK
jgi:hypothetical protein